MSETNGCLTNSDIVNINNALLALDSPVGTVVDGKEQRQPYDLGDKATYATIRNLRKLKSAVEDIAASREALATTYNPLKLKTSALTEEQVRLWETAHAALMKEKADAIIFHKVDLSEFNLPKNKTMPRSIIATLLGEIIKDNAPQDGVV